MTPITIESILAIPKLCSSYTRERLEELFAGRETITPQELLATDINSHNEHSKEDRVWTLSQPGILNEETSKKICELLLAPLKDFEGETQTGVKEGYREVLTTGNIKKALRVSYLHADYVGGQTQEAKKAEQERQYLVFKSVIEASP